MKKFLDEYVLKYETSDFIKNDPVMFAHLYDNEDDTGIAGFIASMFAYGKRELFISVLKKFFDKCGKPVDFVLNFDKNDEILCNFNYRFSKGIDFIQILLILQKLYRKNTDLKTFFKTNYRQTGTITGMLTGVADYFYANVTEDVTRGFYHLIPNPRCGGAMKRMNMMLRWFVRKSAVDVGIWDFIDTSELIIPLDVHVGNISRDLGLLTRKNNDYKSAVEITENLKKFDAKDPVKYDFALFGIGVSGEKESIKVPSVCCRSK